MQSESARYQASAIVKSILQTYNLKATEEIKDNVRKKIESICRDIKVTVDGKKTNLWEKSAQPQGKQTRHYFTPLERQQIITSDELREYIIKNMCDAATAQAYCEAQKEAERANRNYEEFLAEVDYSKVDQQEEYGVPWSEVRQKRLEMMIEALFIETFGATIDTEKLWLDMEISAMGGGQDNTPESVMAAKRLTDVKNYHKKVK